MTEGKDVKRFKAEQPKKALGTIKRARVKSTKYLDTTRKISLCLIDMQVDLHRNLLHLDLELVDFLLQSRFVF